MVHLFSPSMCSFYIRGIHTDIPKDAVLVEQEEFEAVLASHYKTGVPITSDASGRPVVSIMTEEQ